MFLLFGFGKQTVKEYGKTPEEYCGHCQRTMPRLFIRVTTWFTLFFIPIIPYGVKYLLVCPACNNARRVGKEGLDEVVQSLQPMDPADAATVFWRSESSDEPAGWAERGDGEFKTLLDQPGSDRYAGKNPTQKAYLEKLEAHEKALEARERALEAEEHSLE